MERKRRAPTPSSPSWHVSCRKKGMQDYSEMKRPPERNYSQDQANRRRLDRGGSAPPKRISPRVIIMCNQARKVVSFVYFFIPSVSVYVIKISSS
jgi:hypothetical protein